jgi:hypothetical protein
VDVTERRKLQEQVVLKGASRAGGDGGRCGPDFNNVLGAILARADAPAIRGRTQMLGAPDHRARRDGAETVKRIQNFTRFALSGDFTGSISPGARRRGGDDPKPVGTTLTGRARRSS